MITAAKLRFPVDEAPDRPGVEQEIDLSAIADSPYQLRQSHDEDLEGLRDTLVTHGLLQAVVVRRVLGRFELIAGHRRCGAARLAGWKTIRARVQVMDDSRAQECVVIENLLRKDLSAIEEARGFEAMLKRPGGPTQTELAARLGVSQGHVANRLRMLKMPQPFQDAIISGEIPSSYSRAVLPFCEDARAARAIEKVGVRLLKRKTGREQGLPLSYDEFTRELSWAFRQTGYSLQGGEHDPKSGHYISLPSRLSEAQRKDLDVITVKAVDDRHIAVAMNKRLWMELARENHKREEARYSGRRQAQPKKPEAEMNAAEKKRAEEEHRRQQAKMQEQLRRRRKALIVDRLRHLIALRLKEAATTETELLEVTTMALAKQWLKCISGWAVDGILKQGKAEGPVKIRAARLVAECFWNTAEKAPRQVVPEAQVRELSRLLDIDGEAAWRVDQLGPLTRLYWNAHSKSELCGQARAAGMTYAIDKIKKGTVISFLMAAKLPPPAGLGVKPARAPKPR